MSGSYLTFVARRLAAALLIAVVVTAITYVMLRVLRPESFSDPRPLPVQTLDFLRDVFLHFDLGRSFQPPFPKVSGMILEGLPADLSLFGGALVTGAGAGIAGGEIGIFDPGRYTPLTEDPLAWLGSLLVPWAVAGAPLAAICLRMTAASMRELGDEDFVRTALGKGLSPRAVAFKHALPAAASPTLTITGAYTPLLVGNALLVEQVFNIPGVFRHTTGAVSNGDFPVLQGLVLVGAFLVVIGNLAADLVLGRLDPRLRGAQ